MNMWGFIIIIGAIILGFTLTLYVFDKSYFFSDYLLNTYFMLYGNNNLINPSVSQNILAVTVTFMLGVFFLNMLVSIMNDSFDDSQRLKVIKDAKERLDIIFESTNLMRLFFKNRKEEHGYLVFCERVLDYNNADEEVDPKDLTDNINYLKKTIMRSEGNILTKIKKRDQSIQSRLKEIEDKFETLNDSLKKANEENDAEERDKKVNKRMDKLENKLDSITTSIANLTRIINDKMEPPQDDKI